MPAAQSSSSVLTRPQIRAYAKQAGFPDSELDMAVEVAMKESSGNTRALNSVPCYGLWQINMAGQMGTDRRRALGINNNDALYNPAVNAKAAKMIWAQAGGSWRPWTTANSARAAIGKPDQTGDGPALAPLTPFPGGVSGGALPIDPTAQGLQRGTQSGSAIDQLTEKLRLSAMTFAILLVALVLLILGVVVLNRQNVAKLASFTPQGKILKKAGVL